jgi:hypothetical protein
MKLKRKHPKERIRSEMGMKVRKNFSNKRKNMGGNLGAVEGQRSFINR